MSSFSLMQISLFSRPSLTCSGLNILISCMDTFATRFARRCSGLGAKHRGKRVGGLAAGAGSNNVVDGLLKLLAGALNALEVVAQGASNGLFDRVGFRCHTR